MNTPGAGDCAALGHPPARGSVQKIDFSPLAGSYALLETMVFGSALRRARMAWIDRIGRVESVLLVGDGDGRFLNELLAINKTVRVTSIDCSPGMIARARRRIERIQPEALARVDWQCRDIRNAPPAATRYQAVVTQFFLDCFSEVDATSIHSMLGRALIPGGQWLWCDFAVPGNRIRGLCARAGLDLLYRFFRWRTGINARHLPPARAQFARNGFTETAVRRFFFDSIESSVWTAAG